MTLVMVSIYYILLMMFDMKIDHFDFTDFTVKKLIHWLFWTLQWKWKEKAFLQVITSNIRWKLKQTIHNGLLGKTSTYFCLCALINQCNGVDCCWGANKCQKLQKTNTNKNNYTHTHTHTKLKAQANSTECCTSTFSISSSLYVCFISCRSINVKWTSYM